MNDLAIFTGRAHPQLARDICAHLTMDLGQAQVFEFKNENVFVKIEENVRGRDVFVVQSWSSPVNTSIVEMLIMLDALKRASARRITAVIPYYAYGRTDKKDQPRVPITARLLADCLTSAGASRVLTMDLHAGQIQGFFNVPVDELSAERHLVKHFQSLNLGDLTVVATDTGFAKKARNFAELLNAPLAIVEKRRVGNGEDSSRSMGLIGTVRGRHALIVDDEIDSGGTLIKAAELVKREGARELWACATHGVLSGDAVDKIEASPLRELVITDTIPLPEHKQRSKIKVVSVADLFAGAIKRIHLAQSVSELFHNGK